MDSVKDRNGMDLTEAEDIKRRWQEYWSGVPLPSPRPFWYDLNQIPYDYTVEVRNGFKGLDLMECLMNYGQRFMTLYRRQESTLSPRKRNANKQKGV